MSEQRLVYGWGVNDAGYRVEPRVDGKRERCPFYLTWRNIIKRCYSELRLREFPSYRGCQVCEEWRHFSNFRAWMEAQDWKGKHLDKDFLSKDGKLYSPETCAFIHPAVNNFLTDSGRSRGQFKIGVSFHASKGKFQARCCNPLSKKVEHLGYFRNEEQAHDAWLRKKREIAVSLANSEYVTDLRISEALVTRYGLRQQADEQEKPDGPSKT